MIVSKFGGSCVSDSEKVKRTVAIIKANPERRYVMASAPSGITDMLYICYSNFVNREDYHGMLDKISERFKEIINGIGINFDIDEEITTIKKNLISGINSDYVGSRGEYIMGKILAKFLGWEFVDADKIIFFNKDGSLDEGKTFTTAHQKIKDLEHAVIPDFYGATLDGNIKTFSRGDGDSSGAIVARAVEADLFEKWSETAKTFSADPAVIPEPKIIKNITYEEAVELNYIGIKIIRDSVIFMLKKVGIPIKICSIYDGEGDGMLISSKLPENISRNIAICIAGRRNFDIIHIEKYGLNKAYGFGEKLFGLFARYKIACEHCLSGIYKMSIVIKTPTFDLRRSEVLNEIQKILDADSITTEKDLSLIAVIGKGMGATKGTFEKVFYALATAKIKVRIIDQGSDDLNIIIGVSDEDYENAIKALYEAMILKKD